MEDKQNIKQSYVIPQKNESQIPQSKQESLKSNKRRIIRKGKKLKSSAKVAGKNGKPIKRKCRKRRCPDQLKAQQVQSIKVPSEPEILDQIPKIEPPVEIASIPKIEFDVSVLSERIQKLYESKEKLKNTDLVISGVKFIADPTSVSITKWTKALIVYQRPYKNIKNSDRYHFGLLLKDSDLVITFDGVPNLWPYEQVSKSYHWAPQKDTWSCGYRVLFWIRKILTVGIDQWLQKYEPGNVNRCLKASHKD